MGLLQIMDSLNIPAVYGAFDRPQEPPFAVYMGAGQTQFFGDNKIYNRKNEYTLEYYFRKKDAAQEDALETALIDNGWTYEKSEDTYIEDESVFVIYYTTWRNK